MKQVILKHKSGDVIGPVNHCINSCRYELKAGTDNYYGVWLDIHTLNALGFTVEDYVKTRREYWVRYGSGESVLAYLNKHESIPTIHVVELKEGEVIIDREKLKRAWSSCRFEGEDCVEHLAKELGL